MRRAGCNGHVELCSRRLSEVALAGTHNSMSAASLGWSGPNQLVDIPTQLRRGIHAMLIDTYYGVRQANGIVRTVDADLVAARRELGGAAVASALRARGSGAVAAGSRPQVYLCHVLCELGATPLITAFRAVHRHLRANPREVLLFINEDHVRPADYAAVVRASGLIGEVYRGSTSRWPTLGTMVARDQRVVMLAENDSGDVPWYHVAYDGVLQETPYSWPSTADLTDRSRLPASCVPFRGGRTGRLFLMNHWVSSGVPQRSNAQVVNAYRPLLARGRTCRRLRARQPTIVAIDFFGIGNLLAVVDRLNAIPSGGGRFTG